SYVLLRVAHLVHPPPGPGGAALRPAALPRPPPRLSEVAYRPPDGVEHGHPAPLGVGHVHPGAVGRASQPPPAVLSPHAHAPLPGYGPFGRHLDDPVPQVYRVHV